MVIFNRVFTTLLLLALIPAVTVGLIVPREAVQVLNDGIDQLEERLDTSTSAGELVVRIGLAVLIDIALILLIYLELRRPAEYGVPVRGAKGGEAQVAVDSIVRRLEYSVDRLPGVLNVKPHVTPRRGGVQVILEIEAAANTNMPTNVEEVSSLTRRVVEEELGLKLKGKPRLNLRTVAYPESAVGVQDQDPVLTAQGDFSGDTAPTRAWGDEPVPPGVDEEMEIGEVDEPGSADLPD